MTVCVTLTEGFGNNLFQYVAARQLASALGTSVVARVRSEDHSGAGQLSALGLPLRVEVITDDQADGDINALFADESNYREVLSAAHSGELTAPVELAGFFEDYRFFVSELHRVRTWFRPPTPARGSALAVHLRLGDRLFYRAHYRPDGQPEVSTDALLAAIGRFDFDVLHVVTDLPSWGVWTEDALARMPTHVDVPPHSRVPLRWAAARVEGLVRALAPFDPIVHHGRVTDDFERLRGFEQLLFEHSTMAWWAAAVGRATRVGVFGPWRPHMGDENRNLGQTPLPGWFTWE